MLQFSLTKIALTVLVCLVSLLFALPNFFPKEIVASWPGFMPKKQVALGLDLKGGAHLLLAMEVESLRKDWLTNTQQDARRQLRDAKIQFSGVGVANNSVTVRLVNATDVDKALVELRKLNTPIGSALLGTQANSMDVKADGGVITLTPTEAGNNDRVTNAISAALETVRRRIDSLGTTEPSIVRQGRDRIVVQVPGFEDTATLKELIGKTAVLNFHEVSRTSPEEAKTRMPAGFSLFPGDEQSDRGGAGSYVLRVEPIVRGADLVDSQQGFDSRTNEPVINFRFNQKAARDFGRYTQNHIGEPFAIVLDGKVISAPVIRSEILGGSGQISGNFTVKSANELAISLRSGALPAKLTIVEERTVGPSLGSDSVDAGLKAGIIGAIATIIMTILAYGTFGLFACVGLLVHGFMTVAAMTALGSTLTLPGIAGLVLGIAMAVDANVLIFERIREEVRAGKTPISAIDAGFTRAFITIADSQLTTLACAMVMFWLGSGPIRGFAVTLTIGICTSIFASVTVVRLLIYFWVQGKVRERGPYQIPV